MSATKSSPSAARKLSLGDGVLLTAASIVGTGIFFTPAWMASELPHAGLLLAVWVAGGLFSLAGALTYSEIASRLPREAGLYGWLREAYGPLPAFLYGWVAFAAIMGGGIAAIARGLAEGVANLSPPTEIWNALEFPPYFKFSLLNVLAALAIVVATGIQAQGIALGRRAQAAITGTTLAVLGFFAVAGIGALVQALVNPGSLDGSSVGLAANAAGSDSSAAGLSLWAGFGVAMIGALWAYDGWYGPAFAARDFAHPSIDLPRALALGTLGVMLLYAAVQLGFLGALGTAGLANAGNAALAAGQSLFGRAGRWSAGLAVVLAAASCLLATVHYASRIWPAMARDGLFFRGLQEERDGVPVRSLWAQGAWAALLALSGTFTQLATFAVFAGLLFHAGTALAWFELRRRDRGAAAPAFRTPWGALLPSLFLLACLALLGNTLREAPREALIGLGLAAAGLPAYSLWRRRAPRST